MFNKFLFITGRCWLLYLIVALILFFGVNHQIVIFKTLNHLQHVPYNLAEYANGRIEFTDFQFREAIRYYKNVVKVFPDSAAAYSTLGFCYYHLEEIDKSIDYYKKSVGLRQDFFGLYYNLGRIYFETDDFDAAIASFQKALATPPDKTFAYPRIVDPYRSDKTGYRPDDLKQKAADLKIGYEKCYEFIVLSAHVLERFPLMVETALHGANFSEDNKDFFYYYAGLGAFELKNYNAAVKYLGQCIELNPWNRNAYRYLGLSFEEINMPKMSESVLKRARHLDKIEDSKDIEIEEAPVSLYFYPPIRAIDFEGKKDIILM